MTTDTSARPTAALVLGICNIIFGALALCGLAAMLPLLLPNQDDNPVIALMNQYPIYKAFTLIGTAVGTLLGLGLIFAGIGLMNGHRWARTYSITWAGYSLVMVVLGSVINWIYLVEPLLEQAQQRPDAQMAGAVGGAIGGLAGGCIGAIYPIVLLVFMFTPRIKAYFGAAPLAQ